MSEVGAGALFRSVPTSQTLWASDAPYGRPLGSALMHRRCAIEAGVDADGLRAIASENARQILAGAAVAGIPAPATPPTPFEREFLPAPRSDHRYGPLERLLVTAITLARTPTASSGEL